MKNITISVGIVSLITLLSACGGSEVDQLSIELDQPIVVGKTVSLIATTEGSPEAYVWKLGDGNERTTSSPTLEYVYAQAGIYEITVTVESEAHQNSDSVSITIESTAPTAVLNATPTTGPAPLTVQFDSSGSNSESGSITEEYDFGNGIRAGPGASVRHTYQEPGVYEATVTIRGSDGETATDSVTITVGEPARAARTWEVRMVASDDGEFLYDPAVLTIEPGDTVRWVNVNQAHSATAYSAENGKPQGIPTNGPSWNSGILTIADDFFEYTFPASTPSGSYPYYCLPHEFAGQVGIIVVSEYSELDQEFIDSLQGLARDSMMANNSAAQGN